MKHLIAFTFIFFLSCNNQDKKKESSGGSREDLELTPTFKHLSFNSKVEGVIKNFLNEDTCNGCLHEMYIDKVRPNYTIIVIKSRPQVSDYLKATNPLFTIKVAGTNFSVFTGLEDIIIGDKSKALLASDSTGNNFKVWSIYLQSDSLRVEKDIGMPFFPPSPPNIKSR